MQPRAHVLNFLSDEAISPKSAELVIAQNKVHPGVCRTLAQSVKHMEFPQWAGWQL